MNMSLGQKKIYRKCLTKCDILHHVTESSERLYSLQTYAVFVKDSSGKKKKGDHYSPNEICSMIYETHLPSKVLPLSRGRKPG